MFEIPIVLFIFKRTTGLKLILEKIREINPKKLYIIADGPRNENEKKDCKKCRSLVESLVDWDCELIKNYSLENRGVYQNIGLGAKWVFQRESQAIFLEDDNLPEITFFNYCKEMLNMYEKNNKILWICGTNYQGKSAIETSYVFTQHLLPCGWASWANKYNKYYDGNLNNLSSKKHFKNFKNSYKNKSLFHSQLISIKRTKNILEFDKRKSSWDYQMLFSIRSNELLGIMPANNQIKNIGVDDFSIHGGTNMQIEMTKRLCGMSAYPLEFPLTHPTKIEVSPHIENEIGNIILCPLKTRLYSFMTNLFISIFGMQKFMNLKNGRKDR